uniref:Poly(A) polymerase n=1 Tax=Macrostomum lignano TaxID=282301 RepID=A0A1I8G3B1_9PLAT
CLYQAMDSESKVQQQQAAYKGVTCPLSLAEPTEDDLKETRSLEEMMKRMNVFESQEGMEQRSTALISLQALACDWISEVAAQKCPSQALDGIGGKIFAFGSYRLGVNTRGADVDAVLVSTRFIERHEFFDKFFDRLREHPRCGAAHAVSDAFVPVIKMTFMGVDIDLLFAKLDMATIPDNIDLRENTETLLRNLDERCVRSINGCRVTDEILHQVPNPENFRVALKVIRIWAKNRGIYSNAMGFLGGVSWAILLARIAQLYPNAAPNVLIIRFFHVLTRWSWPKPVELCELSPPNLHFPEWDPRTNIKDQFHLMPIITPVYPRQNSTYNVSISTKQVRCLLLLVSLVQIIGSLKNNGRSLENKSTTKVTPNPPQVILAELERGRNLTNEIMFKQKSWEDLLEPVNFFDAYRHYVIVIASSDTAELHLDFQGLVESQLRKLVLSFEHNGAIDRAHVNTESYGRANESEPEHVTKWFIGIEFKKAPEPGKKLNVDLTFDITNFIRQINGMANSLQLRLDVLYSKKRGLSHYLPPSEHWKINRSKPACVY